MNLEEWKKFISSIDILDINNKKSTDSYARLINQMEHCIGMDYRKPYKRNGVMYYKPYRNHYDTVDEMWDALVEIGYAYKNRMYHLTLSGIGWLSFMNGTFIYNPCAESEFDTYKEVFKFFCKMDVSCCYGCWFPVSTKQCMANLLLPYNAAKKAINRMVEEGYLTRGHCGGCTEDGFPYCVHGYYCTRKVEETDIWRNAEKEEIDYINNSLNRELEDRND